MEHQATIQQILKEFLEPIIDECISNSFSKHAGLLSTSQSNLGEIMDINAASKYLSLSKSFMYKLTHTRKIPHYKHCKHLYFKKDELNEWIAKGKIMTREEIEREASAYIMRKGRS